MPKRRNVIFGVVAFVVVAGVVAVIVLAALGYFNKKSAGGSGGSGTNANYVGPTASLDPTPGIHPTGGYVANCNLPLEIVDVKQTNRVFTVYLSSSTPYYRCNDYPGMWELSVDNVGYARTGNIVSGNGNTVISFMEDLPKSGGKYTAKLSLTNGSGAVSNVFTFTLQS